MSAAVQDSAITLNSSSVPVALGSNGFQGRAGVTVFNAGPGNIYLGGPAVTTATGLAVASNATPVTVSTPEGAALYAVTSATGTVARIIEF